MISVSELVRVLIFLLVAGVIWMLLQWLVDYVNPPEPFKKVARIVLAILAVLVCIGALLTLAGYPVFRP